MGAGAVARRGGAGRPRPEGGFTMVEMVVAVALAAFLLVTLSSVMYSSLRAIGVQKSRSRANDLTTMGIEDLQRLSYASLGLCAAPGGPPPPGLGDTVLLANCGGPPPSYGPCQPGPAPAGSVPDEEYTCTERNIVYTVRRFIGYDATHTEKRLAVVTEWDDSVGHHQVSQQSSLRIPTQSLGVGLAPPAITGTDVVPPAVTLEADGSTKIPVTVTATLGGSLTAAQKADLAVVAVFETFAAGGRQQRTLTLTGPPPGPGQTWTGTLAAGEPGLGVGEQFVVFSAVRGSDGKVGGRVHPTALGVGLTGPVPAYPPTLAAVAGRPPAAVPIDPRGALTGPVEIEASTTNVARDDQVTVTFETQTGVVSVALAPTDGSACPPLPDACPTTWRVVLGPGNGFLFSPGARPLYLMAKQVPDSTGTRPVVFGSGTAAVKTTAVTFG